MMQLVYEASTHCTSLVTELEGKKTPVHIRTMEWELPCL